MTLNVLIFEFQNRHLVSFVFKLIQMVSRLETIDLEVNKKIRLPKQILHAIRSDQVDSKEFDADKKQ